MRPRRPRPVSTHSRGVGANLDVMTLSGYRAGSRGIWKEVYSGQGGFPKKKKCVSWKTVGKGCDCKPQCASFTTRSAGVSKKKAVSQCERKCKTKKRKKRGRK